MAKVRRIPFKHILGRFAGLLALGCIFALSSLAAPTVTITASAQSILGTTQTVSMTVTLIDPNTTGMLKAGAVVVTNFTATSSSATTVSIGPIFGNDVIADGFGNLNQTYYKVQVFPVSNGIIASTPALQNFYAFIGSGTIDVSNATPLSPSFQTGTSGNVVLPGTLSVSGLITASGGLSVTGALSATGLITASSGVGGIGPKFQQFTSSGTFTIPANVTSVKVTVVGGGGAGGGSTAANSGASGGAGGAAFKYLSGLTPGNTITVTVGAGGTGVSGASGNTGTASSISSGTQVITTVTANSGTGGGTGAGTQFGGTGGTATSGDLNFTGNPGNPNLSGSGSTGVSGAGSIFGGGGQNVFQGPGNAGTAPGAGGGGTGSNGAGNLAGGVGANGIVIFEWVN